MGAMSVLAALDVASLRRFFDPGTLARGITYARDGHVGEPEVFRHDPTTVVAGARVLGTRPVPYQVQLYAEHVDGLLWMTTSCSCPVRVECKHGAALAVTLGDGHAAGHAGGDPARDWELRLGGLLDELAGSDEGDSPDHTPVPLALELTLDDPRDHRHYYSNGPGSSPRPRPRVRPLRRGARARWVKGGADWRELSGTHHAFPVAQLDALLDLRAVLQTERPQWLYGGPAPVLADFGRRLVPLLRRAVAEGVELVARPPLTEVALLSRPVEVVADVTRHAEGRVLRIGVRHDGLAWNADSVLPLGSPAHAVALLSEGVLTLAETSRPLSPTLLRLLDEGGEVRVPESDTDELAGMLAPLTRWVTIHSSDSSLELPELPRPLLWLTVTWRSATDATLAWEWRYADQRCELGSADRLGGLRDRAAEQAILERVPAGLAGASEVRGGEALSLAVHDLPALREVDGVEVVEEERPDFRETEAPPEISFDVVEPVEVDHPTDWLDLEVTISVEGERIPLPDVLAALTLGEDHLVLPSGLYLRTDRPEFDRLRDVVAAAAELREAEGDTVSVGSHDLGVWAQLAELGVVDEQAAEWVSRARALRDLVELPRPEPTGLATELRSYQRDGFHWLAFLWQHRLGGILADDMGLGKTLQVLALVAHAGASGERRPFLVVAPTSVVSAWVSEAARHTPGLRVRAMSRQAADVAGTAADADVVVTTYALLRLAQERYAAVDWGGLVLDEAQQVKNHQSKSYGAVRRIEAPFRLAVTGTPFENRLMELWALLSITTPGLYPRPRAFTEHVVRPVEKERDDSALHRFRQRIRPFLLRRTKELVAAELPPKQEQVLAVELSPRHRRLYDTHLAKERQRILGLVDDFERNRVAIFSALTRLRQLALDPALVDADHERVGSAKIDLLVEHLEEIAAEGHRALVFSQFTSFLRRVEARLHADGITTCYLDGTTRDRPGVIESFRAGDDAAFLISLKAGGVGLTLTEADYVFVLDPWWNPAAEAQAVDRAYRIGQTRHVHVYRLIATETIEEKVMELKGRKAELFAQVVDGDGTAATPLTAADVRALFDQ